MELLKKLRLNTELPLWAVNMPDSCRHLFEELEIKDKLGRTKPVDQLIVFAKDSTELNHLMIKVADYVGHNTLFWICYPKQSGAIKSDLITMQAWEFVFQMGYRGQTSVAIDDDWSSLRVTNAPPKKPSTYNIPPEERNIEGIDFVNRTVTLPPDALAAMKPYKGMADYFYTMSFTNKKEAVISLVEAKKEETRKKRLDKLVETLKAKIR